MANDKTLKEAMISHALEEIELTLDRVEKISTDIRTLADNLPVYLEESSNQVADNLQHAITSDVNKAQDRLKTVHKQVSDSVEVQRKLNAQLMRLNKSLNNSNQLKNNAIMFVSAFLGGFVAVMLGFIIFI